MWNRHTLYTGHISIIYTGYTLLLHVRLDSLHWGVLYYTVYLEAFTMRSIGFSQCTPSPFPATRRPSTWEPFVVSCGAQPTFVSACRMLNSAGSLSSPHGQLRCWKVCSIRPCFALSIDHLPPINCFLTRHILYACRGEHRAKT